MYLLDTNIILEILFGQKNAEKCYDFIYAHQNQELFLTDFAYFSISVKLFNFKKYSVSEDLRYEFIDTRIITIIKLELGDWEKIIQVSSKYNFDFDDSYQFVAAEKYNLKIVSYDKDFDLTSVKRLIP